MAWRMDWLADAAIRPLTRGPPAFSVLQPPQGTCCATSRPLSFSPAFHGQPEAFGFPPMVSKYQVLPQFRRQR